jgi:hypothetical protein
MARALPQLVVPSPDHLAPHLELIGVHRAAGRLYRCRRCGAEVWSCYGRARRHRQYCRRRDYPGGRP